MSFARWSAIFALALAPLAAVAQDKPTQAEPADPAAAVPASRYESAFHNYRAFVDSNEPPAKAWRAANDEMGRLGGHMGQIDGTPASANPGGSQPKPEPNSQPKSEPNSQPNSQPKSEPAQHGVHLKSEGKE